jgi:cell division protein FtsL
MKLFKMGSLTLWMIAVVSTGVAHAAYLALRFETLRIGYEVGRVRNEHERLVATQRLVALEVQSLRERQRVGTIASRSLGMGAPDVARVVTVDGAGPSRALGVRRAR